MCFGEAACTNKQTAALVKTLFCKDKTDPNTGTIYDGTAVVSQFIRPDIWVLIIWKTERVHCSVLTRLRKQINKNQHKLVTLLTLSLFSLHPRITHIPLNLDQVHWVDLSFHTQNSSHAPGHNACDVDKRSSEGITKLLSAQA